jgi:hypothetical protein
MPSIGKSPIDRECGWVLRLEVQRPHAVVLNAYPKPPPPRQPPQRPTGSVRIAQFYGRASEHEASPVTRFQRDEVAIVSHPDSGEVTRGRRASTPVIRASRSATGRRPCSADLGRSSASTVPSRSVSRRRSVPQDSLSWNTVAVPLRGRLGEPGGRDLTKILSAGRLLRRRVKFHIIGLSVWESDARRIARCTTQPATLPRS